MTAKSIYKNYTGPFIPTKVPDRGLCKAMTKYGYLQHVGKLEFKITPKLWKKFN